MKSFIAVFAIGLCAGAEAADFAFGKGSDGGTNLHVEGSIIPGDTDKLLKLIVESPSVFLGTRRVILNSRGGSIIEAMKISEIVEKSAFISMVPESSICASSCLFVWLGSPIRASEGRILIHRPYLSAEAWDSNNLAPSAERQRVLMGGVRDFLEGRKFPSKLVDEMMRRASNDAYELTDVDVYLVGAFSPEFEEASIARCGVGGKELGEDAIRPSDWKCIFALGDVQRLQYLFELIGPERGREAAQLFLESKGYVRAPDGRMIEPEEP